jgi:hypothetical protein
MFKKIKEKMEYSFIKLLLARIKSKSPKFYITLRYVSGALVFLAGLGIAVVNSKFFPISSGISNEILSISTKIGPLMTGVWGTSFLGTTDTNLIQEINPTTKS